MFHIKLNFIRNFIVVAMFGLSFPAFGAPGHDDKFMGLETRDMNLTAEQKQKLKEIQDRERDGMKAKREAMCDLQHYSRSVFLQSPDRNSQIKSDSRDGILSV